MLDTSSKRHKDMVKTPVARFVRLRPGLVEPQHVAAMGGGSPFVLYVWLHTQVKYEGEGAGTTWPTKPYRHEDAAHALGAPQTSVRRWCKTLVDSGYITTVRGRYGLAVTITKYQPERAPEAASDSPPMDSLNTPQIVHPWTVSENPECPPVVGQVSTHGQSQRHPWTLSKDARAKSLKENKEILSPTEKGGAPAAPDAPAPAVRGNPNVQAAIDALRGQGMTGVLTPRDRAALKTTTADLGEMARLYAAIFHGEYGDQFMHDNLSVLLCLEKLPGWQSHQAGHQAPAKRNGKYGRSAKVADAIENFGKVLDDAGYDERAQGRLPSVRSELRRLPS